MNYCSFNSPLGPLSLFEDDGALVALDWGYPPEIKDKSPLLDEACLQLESYFCGELKEFTVPLAPMGTDFQLKLWDILKKIPYGETMFYGELAEKIKTKPQAIGGACGRNPLPIFIPCHRVIHKNKTLSGYSSFDRGESKKFLLKIEGVKL